MTAHRERKRVDLYMRLRDRKKLATIMVIQGYSQRTLASACGRSGHSFIGRLLRGEENTLSTDLAVRIANILGVPLEDLFVVQMSSPSGQTDRKKKRAA